MKRRKFLAVACAPAIVALPWGAYAQQPRKHRIGFLYENSLTFPDARAAFHQELQRLGYVEGQNLFIEYRWAEGKWDRMRAQAEELVQLSVDVIVAPSSIYTAAAKAATSTIPIVFLSHADPLRTGHVATLAQPGGNITGLSLMMTETNVKSLELLKETIPGLTRVAVLFDPATPSHVPGLRAAEMAGPRLHVQVQPVPASNAVEFEEAFKKMNRERVEAVLVLSTPLVISAAELLSELGLRHKIPSLYGPKQHVAAGGMMSYSPDRADLWRRGAQYVDMILRGAKPSNLAVQEPLKFELVINLKTAMALGIVVPEAILARADEVIE